MLASKRECKRLRLWVIAHSDLSSCSFWARIGPLSLDRMQARWIEPLVPRVAQRASCTLVPFVFHASPEPRQWQGIGFWSRLKETGASLSAHLMGGPSTQVAVPWRESGYKGCRRNILLTTAQENTERPHHRPGGRGKGVKTAQNLRNHRGRGTFSCLPPVTWQHMAPPPLKSFAAEEHTDLTPQECCREDVGTKNSPQPVKTAWKSSHKSVGRHLPGCLRRVTCRKWHHKTCNNITHNTTEHCRGREPTWSDNPQNK